MKNILIIHSNLEGGGAERVLVDYLNNIDLIQYSITLLLVWNSYKPNYLSAIPPQIKVVFVSKTQKLTKFEFMLYRFGLHNIIEKRQLDKLKLGYYDIIISFMEGLALKYHSQITSNATRNITWVHIDFVKNHWSKIFFKSILQECKIYNTMSDIVFVSIDAKISFNKLFAINKNVNQEVITNPIDKDRIINQSAEFDVKKNKFTVIGVGRLTEQKRFDRFIDVAKILIDKNLDIEFWILGTGELESELKEKAKKLGVLERIVFKGFVDNPYPYIKEADIFLLTSDAEGYPTVICESLVLGKPVVMTRVAGANELLCDSEYGIISIDKSPDIIASDIERLYFDNKLFEFYKFKSSSRAQIFEIDITMEKIYKLI